MDIPNSSRHRPKIHPPSERFLGAYPHAPPSLSPSDVSDELTEDDIFWTSSDFSAAAAAAETNHHHQNNNNQSTPATSASSTPRRQLHRGFSQPEAFGILAALPDRNDAVSSSSFSPRPGFFRKAAASSSASSSSSPSYAQMIPTIPKPPTPHHHENSNRSSFSSSFKYQSVPVNVPVMMRKKYKLEAVADEEADDDDGEMLPPHEIVARSAARSPEVAYSLLEGVGRTLKGRDLRRVRNAVWRRTGFLD